ncbi:MAG: hypothetical protein HYY04_05930 [Chloroflexi bacterium]|nr:hypothetical protein [Chloroflexota bacterium]
MPTKTFWVVRNRRHQDFVYRSSEGVKLRFDSSAEARKALEEAERAYPREGWEITELQSYLGSPQSDEPSDSHADRQ